MWGRGSFTAGLPVLAQFERTLIRERTNAGLAAARARGRFGEGKMKTTPQQDKQVRALWESKNFTGEEIAKLLHDLRLVWAFEIRPFVAALEAILVSWTIALFAYCLVVPDNRLGYGEFSGFQLKIIQEVVTLVVFMVFAIVFLTRETCVELCRSVRVSRRRRVLRFCLQGTRSGCMNGSVANLRIERR